MSFGEGNLRERVERLERENAELKSLVHDLTARIYAAEDVDGMTWLDARMRERMVGLGIEVRR